LTNFVPLGSSAALEADGDREQATHLNYLPSQLQLAHAYEFVILPFAFNTCMSMDYYHEPGRTS
jgi:hypothetical protein